MLWKPKHPFLDILNALVELKVPAMVTTKHVIIEDVLVDFVGKNVVEFINDDVDPEENIIYTVRTVVKLEDIVCISYDYGATNLEDVYEDEGILHS